MTVFEAHDKSIPPYSPTMYMQGYTPAQILYAAHRQMMEQAADNGPDDYNIHITSEVKKI